MTLTRDSSGTQTATPGSDHTVGSPTASGFYQFVVDYSNLVANEFLEMRVKIPVLNAGTKRTVFVGMYAGTLLKAEKAIAISPPVPVVDDSDFVLKQVGGSSRQFPWAILKASATLTRDSSGTQTATLDTEHILASPVAAAFYYLLVDLNNMQAGDVLRLRAKVPALNAGTPRALFRATYDGKLIGADGALALSPAIPVIDDSDFILEQTDGTGRQFPWTVLKAI